MNFLLNVFGDGDAELNPMNLLSSGIIPMVLIFGAMWAFMILTQKKREKKNREMINAAIVGDKVITIGGIMGKIVNIKDDEFTIESGNERTKVTVKKWAVKEVEKPVTE